MYSNLCAFFTWCLSVPPWFYSQTGLSSTQYLNSNAHFEARNTKHLELEPSVVGMGQTILSSHSHRRFSDTFKTKELQDSDYTLATFFFFF